MKECIRTQTDNREKTLQQSKIRLELLKTLFPNNI
jgi:hypothetical protein